MPVITFLSDLISLTKGPYYRLVGRHTQHYSLRAARRAAKNEKLKRVLSLGLVGADDWVAAYLGVPAKPSKSQLPLPAPHAKPAKILVVYSLKAYLSALLLLLGSQKAQLLERLDMDDRQLLDMWCQVFEYNPDDMKLFDEILSETYRQNGFDGLIQATRDAVVAKIPLPIIIENQTLELSSLASSLVKDLTAIQRFLGSGKEGETP